MAMWRLPSIETNIDVPKLRLVHERPSDDGGFTIQEPSFRALFVNTDIVGDLTKHLLGVGKLVLDQSHASRHVGA